MKQYLTGALVSVVSAALTSIVFLAGYAWFAVDPLAAGTWLTAAGTLLGGLLTFAAAYLVFGPASKQSTLLNLEMMNRLDQQLQNILLPLVKMQAEMESYARIYREIDKMEIEFTERGATHFARELRPTFAEFEDAAKRAAYYPSVRDRCFGIIERYRGVVADAESIIVDVQNDADARPALTPGQTSDAIVGILGEVKLLTVDVRKISSNLEASATKEMRSIHPNHF